MAAIRTPLGRVLLEPYHAVKKIPDIFYLVYAFGKNDLPVYELKIDSKDLKFLNENLPEAYSGERLTDEYRESVPATFIYQGQEYKVKVSYRGYISNHWANPKKSWDINFNNKSPFKGLDGLKLIIPEDRGVVLEYLNYYRARKFGLYPMWSHFAVLKVNGHNNGVYFVNEPWDKEYLAKYELLDETDMFAYDDNWERTDREFDSFEEMALYTKQADNPFDPFSNYAPLDKFFALVNGDESLDVFAKEIVKIVDVEKFLNLQALRSLASSPHNVYRNIRFFTNRENGKLVFIPWDVGVFEPDSDLELVTSKFYGKMRLAEEFAYRRNKILWDYVSSDENLEDDLRYYDDAFKEIRAALVTDWKKAVSTRSIFKMYRENRELLIDNFRNVKDILSDARASIIVYWQNGVPVYFDVANDKAPEVSISSVAMEGFEKPINFEIYSDTNETGVFDAGDKLIAASETSEENIVIANSVGQILSAKRAINDSETPGVFDTIAYLPKSYRFFIKIKDVGGVKDIKIKLNNALSGGDVETKTQNINADSYQYLSLVDQSIEEFIGRYPVFQKSGSGEIYLAAGNYLFDRDVIIPKGTKLTIAAGVRINLAAGISIVSYSPVEVAGRPELPVIFDAAVQGSAWGSFGISEAEQKSSINYAIFKNGRDDHINGVYYSGMVSIYLSDVDIDGCQFFGARADDSLNIKKGKATVKNSYFEKNSADAIDLDYVKEGLIYSNRFFANGNDSIDLSGSGVKIESNYIEESGDKCISVGEKSLGPVIYNNVLNGCNIGIEAKDGSQVYVINNVIIDNKTAGINGYLKKAIFPDGFVNVYNSIIWGNKEVSKTDGTIAISFFNSDLSQNDDKNGNFSVEPMFNNSNRDDFTIKAENGNILFATGGDSAILQDKLGVRQEQVPVGLNR